MIQAVTGNRNKNNNKNNQNPFIRVYKICTFKKSVSTEVDVIRNECVRKSHELVSQTGKN